MNIFDKIKIRRMLRKKDTYQIIIDNGKCNKDTLKYYYKIFPKYNFYFIRNIDALYYWCNPQRVKKMKALIPEDIQLYYDNELYEKIKNDSVCLRCPHYKICSYKGG